MQNPVTPKKGKLTPKAKAGLTAIAAIVALASLLDPEGTDQCISMIKSAIGNL
jgi:hypothetical protein